MKRSKKMRLIFLGIRLMSLFYALIGFLRFCLGFKGIRISGNPPYMWLGDVPFVSFLSSLFLGSLFNVLERVWEVWEKQRL